MPTSVLRQAKGNGEYNSVETEGYPTEPLTAVQESMLARLYLWGAHTYHWQFVLAEKPGQHGFGWHGMGGSAWGGHIGCPGDLRKNRRQSILNVAAGHPASPAAPASAKPPGTGPAGSHHHSSTATCGLLRTDAQPHRAGCPHLAAADVQPGLDHQRRSELRSSRRRGLSQFPG